MVRKAVWQEWLIAVDTSVIVAVVTNEPHKQQLIKATDGADLLAPASLPFEIGNAFSAMFKRERISKEDAVRALHLYQRIPVQLVEMDLESALELAQRKSPLLTLDKLQKKAAGQANVEVIEVPV